MKNPSYSRPPGSCAKSSHQLTGMSQPLSDTYFPASPIHSALCVGPCFFPRNNIATKKEPTALTERDPNHISATDTMHVQGPAAPLAGSCWPQSHVQQPGTSLSSVDTRKSKHSVCGVRLHKSSYVLGPQTTRFLVFDLLLEQPTHPMPQTHYPCICKGPARTAEVILQCIYSPHKVLVLYPNCKQSLQSYI